MVFSGQTAQIWEEKCREDRQMARAATDLNAISEGCPGIARLSIGENHSGTVQQVDVLVQAYLLHRLGDARCIPDLSYSRSLQAVDEGTLPHIGKAHHTYMKVIFSVLKKNFAYTNSFHPLRLTWVQILRQVQGCQSCLLKATPCKLGCNWPLRKPVRGICLNQDMLDRG